MKFSFKEDAKRIVVICIASVIMALNIKTFVRTGGLYPGGATGLTLLIQRIVELFFGFELPYTIINVLLNLVPIYIGFRFIGKKFTLYSCLCIMLTNILTDILPSHAIVYDTLLISVFGGMINGFAISLCLMMNATTGGTDFIAQYVSNKIHKGIWDYVFYFNCFMYVCYGFVFGWKEAGYSIIFQFLSTKTISSLYQRYEQITIEFTTAKPQLVIDSFMSCCRHGMSIIEAHGAYSNKSFTSAKRLSARTRPGKSSTRCARRIPKSSSTRTKRRTFTATFTSSPLNSAKKDDIERYRQANK